MSTDDMRKIIDLIENAQRLDEINLKKAAATAGLIGALAGSPSFAQNTDFTPNSQSDQSVLHQTDVSKGEKLYQNFYSGMSIEDVAKLSGGKIRKNGVSSMFTDAALVGYTGLVDPKNLNVYAKIGDTKVYFEFMNNRLVAVHLNITIPNNSDIRDGQGLFGFQRAEMPRVFSNAFKSVKTLSGNANGKAKSSDGGGFGLGVGGITKNGTGVALGLDKTGSGAAWIKTENGYMAMSYSTQKGMVNTFRPGSITVGLVSSQKPKDEIEFESSNL